MSWSDSARKALFLCSLIMFFGCSAIVQNMQSTDQKELGHPPFYHDFTDFELQTDNIAIFPVGIAFRDGEDWFRPSLRPLATAMNDYLFAEKGYKKYEPAAWRQEGAPAVRFGDPVSLFRPDEEEEDRYESMQMVLLATHPSRAWKEDWNAVNADRPDYVLIIQVGLSAYKVSQKDWKGNKEIRLGTGYLVPVPWLTSMSDPVPVVHITGTLLSKDGSLLRAGAEAFFVKRVSFVRSLFGFGEWITSKDVDTILTDHVRSDLNGQPLAWTVAVDHMVNRLLALSGR